MHRLLIITTLVSLASPLLKHKMLAKPVERVLNEGETIGMVAENLWGDASYELVLRKQLNLPDTGPIPAGTKLKLWSDIKELLYDEGLPKTFGADLNKMLDGRYAYVKVRNDLLRAMEVPGVGQKVVVPVSIREELEKGAALLDQAGKSLAKRGKYEDTPVRVRQRLEKAAETMRLLAKGTPSAKIEEQVHTSIAQAWVRLIMWARADRTPGPPKAP